MGEETDDSGSVRTWRRASSGGRSVEYPRSPTSTSIDITALDGIVNVNSLFTLGVFLGLTWNPSGTLASDCAPEGNGVARNMVTFHVFSFSSFLFSSLVALCLKQKIRIHRNHHHHSNGSSSHRALDRYPFSAVEKVNKALLRAGILVSAVGSVSGCGFLMLALVNVVQIKLGRLECSSATAAAVVPLITFVPAAMLIYVSVVFYAFTR